MNLAGHEGWVQPLALAPVWVLVMGSHQGLVSALAPEWGWVLAQPLVLVRVLAQPLVWASNPGLAVLGQLPAGLGQLLEGLVAAPLNYCSR
jgi:hypothetical protein